MTVSGEDQGGERKRTTAEVSKEESSKREIMRREGISWERLKKILAYPEPPEYNSTPSIPLPPGPFVILPASSNDLQKFAEIDRVQRIEPGETFASFVIQAGSRKAILKTPNILGPALFYQNLRLRATVHASPKVLR